MRSRTLVAAAHRLGSRTDCGLQRGRHGRAGVKPVGAPAASAAASSAAASAGAASAPAAGGPVIMTATVGSNGTLVVASRTG